MEEMSEGEREINEGEQEINEMMDRLTANTGAKLKDKMQVVKTVSGLTLIKED